MQRRSCRRARDNQFALFRREHFASNANIGRENRAARGHCFEYRKRGAFLVAGPTYIEVCFQKRLPDFLLGGEPFNAVKGDKLDLAPVAAGLRNRCLNELQSFCVFEAEPSPPFAIACPNCGERIRIVLATAAIGRGENYDQVRAVVKYASGRRDERLLRIVGLQAFRYGAISVGEMEDVIDIEKIVRMRVEAFRIEKDNPEFARSRCSCAAWFSAT